MLSGAISSGLSFRPIHGNGGTTGGSTSITVQRGDTFNGIAARHGLSPDALHRANPQIADRNWIFPGQEIALPSASQARSETQVTVQYGDTFNGIAARHGVSPEALHKANPDIADPNWIFAGQTLRVPAGGELQEGITTAPVADSVGVHRGGKIRADSQVADVAQNGIAATEKTALGDFREMAPRIMDSLMKDLKLTVEDAAAILGNLGHETGGFKDMQEKNVSRGRGGYGWAHWTGSRRSEFEAYCKKNELDKDSYEANYQFLVLELKGSHKDAIPALQKAQGLKEKVEKFDEKFEKAGTKNYESRERYANIALNAYKQRMASK